MINHHIPTYGSMILAFTQCYAGNTAIPFAGMANTAILNGGTPGTTTIYGGFHRGLAKNLKPGTNTNGAFGAASGVAKPGDSPNKSGSDLPIGIAGPITSTHVLVWAGKPESLDQDDINDISANFPDNGTTQTVTVLSGNGTGANVDAAATRANLVASLKDIGAKMNANEQFILFVTDHGDLHQSKPLAITGGTGAATIQITNSNLVDIVSQPSPDPSLTLISPSPVTDVTGHGILLNGKPVLNFTDSFFDIFTEIPLTLDISLPPYAYKYMTKANSVTTGMLTSDDVLESNLIQLGGIDSFFDVFTEISLDSGPIMRAPEPATLAVLGVIGAWTLTRRERRAA